MYTLYFTEYEKYFHLWLYVCLCVTLKLSTMNWESTKKTPHTRNSHCWSCSTNCFMIGRWVYSSIWPAKSRREAWKITVRLTELCTRPLSTWRLTWAVKKYVIVLYMSKTFFQPVKVISKVLHAKDQPSIWAESQWIVLHYVIHLDQLFNVCGFTVTRIIRPLVILTVSRVDNRVQTHILKCNTRFSYLPWLGR